MSFFNIHLCRNISKLASRALARPRLATLSFAILAFIAVDLVATAAGCPGTVSGQRIMPGRTQHGFGAVQGLPPLTLAANEYVITIDDGPSAETTPRLLDALRAHCVKATFFLIGEKAAANPDLVKEISAQGHAIGSHSYRHPNLATLTEAEIVEEMQQGVDAVDTAQKGERRTKGWRLIRLPGSANSSPIPSATLIEALHQKWLTIAGYDLSPQDWRNSPPEESFNRLFHAIRDRGVIVFHDGQSNTILLLPMVLEELSRRGAKIRQLVPRPRDG
jgi:peptidoglycan/xylan/chitin deacetylase (PgdA/CDA1 family)